ncbi:MAG: class I SAM-dependent methyltransferase [Candidatus Woesearchaeota archaeon]
MKDKLKEAIQTYNKIANLYAEYTETKIMQYQISKFTSVLPGKKVLDAGCGVGRDVAYMEEDGLDITGIDISEGILKEAKKRYPKSKFKLMDFRKMSFKAKSFDGIWSMAGLIHTDRNEMPKILKEFNRILKQNGIIYLAVVEGEGEEEVRKQKYENEPRTYVYYKLPEIEKFLGEAGFQIMHSEISQTDTKNWVEVFARKIN